MANSFRIVKFGKHHLRFKPTRSPHKSYWVCTLCGKRAACQQSFRTLVCEKESKIEEDKRPEQE